MLFKTEDDAIHYAIDKTSRNLSPKEISSRIVDYQRFYSQAINDEDKTYWKMQIEALDKWKNSNDYITGNFPTGIDELIYTLFDCRSLIYAYKNMDSSHDPFLEYHFFQQWIIGITNTIFNTIGKLLSKCKDDNSLRKLWFDVVQYIEKYTLSNSEEINYINSCFAVDGYFCNKNSKALLFRNKTVAHNEASPLLKWEEIDKDIRILTRMWSLIIMWCSHGVLKPFQKAEFVFKGMEFFFNETEVSQLKELYSKSCLEITDWCNLSIINNTRLSTRTPFVQISITMGTAL